MCIYLTVVVKAKPAHLQEIKTLLYSLPELSKKEEACIEYDVHQSIDDENIFILNEKWESLEGLKLIYFVLSSMTLVLNLSILNLLTLHFDEILKDQNRFKIYLLLGIALTADESIN